MKIERIAKLEKQVKQLQDSVKQLLAVKTAPKTPAPPVKIRKR